MTDVYFQNSNYQILGQVLTLWHYCLTKNMLDSYTKFKNNIRPMACKAKKWVSFFPLCHAKWWKPYFTCVFILGVL